MPKITLVRLAVLLAMSGSIFMLGLACTRLLGMWIDEDPRIAMGAWTGLVLLSCHMTAPWWLRWACIPPELPPEHLNRTATALARLSGKVGLEVSLHVVKSKRVFIYSTGIFERLIVISDTAIRELSADAMEGVLAHELAHMALNHPRKNAILFASLFGLRIALTVPPLVSIYVVLMILMHLRNHEFEADQMAALMTSPDKVRLALTEVQRLTKFKDMNFVIEFLISTHPTYRKRHAALMKTSNEK